MTYAAFLERKQRVAQPDGKATGASEAHPMLHDWQRMIVAWACHRGRAAIFADCGLGKTFMQLEWARLMHDRGALIVAPLSVAGQTIREGKRIGVEVEYITDTPGGSGGIYITNYERLDGIDAERFDAVVLDESSILKNYVGKTRTAIIDQFKATPYRLACTATPAPNDVAELTNHAEFLGRSTRQDMLGAYFITNMDKGDGGGYRLKGHAKDPMFRWMAQWAVSVRRPSDLSGSDEGYLLPGLDVHPEIVSADVKPDGQLFATDLGGVGGRAQIRRETMEARVERAVQIAEAHRDEQIILWAGLNDEADALAAAVPGSVNVQGSWSPDAKAEALEAFQSGDLRVLITKPSIAGFGMNFQNARRMAFVGLGDSYEAYYQAIRRCYRFGQQRRVHVHVVVSDIEQQIALNVARKERASSEAADLLARFETVTTYEGARR